MKIVLFLAAYISTFAFGQIEFKHLTLEEGKALALKEKKPLFVDVFATWCGPCKQMANTTFQDPAISEYYNKNFVCIKIDGEKADGPAVMSKYEISAYPTLLYINSKGELITKHIGGMNIPTMKRLGIQIIEPEKDPVLIASKAFHVSKKQKTDLVKFITVLNENQSDSLKKYTTLYYQQNPKTDFSNAFDYMIFNQSETDYNSENVKEFLNKLSVLEPKSANDKMVNLILYELEKSKQSQNFNYCEEAMRLFYPHLKSLNMIQLPELDALLAQLRLESEAAY